jgi:Cu-Zn family superoxide dismutase
MRLVLTAAAVLVGCTLAANAQDQAKGNFVNIAGEKNGMATATASPNGVLFQVEVSGLPAGEWVAVHVHENGKCDHHTKYESSGGHFNPGKVEHGYLNEKGPHAGDLPNQRVGDDGMLRVDIFSAAVSLEGDNGVRGKALMIHGGKDDYKSQPAGNAGDRIACALLE